VQVLRRIVLRAALPGIATGVILALAISVGETAPLLYTAGASNGYWSGQFLGLGGSATAAMPYLTYVTWTDYSQPIPAAVQLSYDSALLLVVLVVALILLARLVVRATQKYSPERAAGSGGRFRAGRRRPAAGTG
jgi:phosphate transport system permease protein